MSRGSQGSQSGLLRWRIIKLWSISKSNFAIDARKPQATMTRILRAYSQSTDHVLTKSLERRLSMGRCWLGSEMKLCLTKVKFTIVSSVAAKFLTSKCSQTLGTTLPLAFCENFHIQKRTYLATIAPFVTRLSEPLNSSNTATRSRSKNYIYNLIAQVWVRLRAALVKLWVTRK